ncbi:MAG: glycosyltransferase family 2 protein [DPANN group archaeon]|nr:glycosyltransferase family 2 protein [DPANN group archaeon]
MKDLISIIIPAFNEEKSINNTIVEVKSVLNKSYDNYEIIVINDGSKDKTSEIIKKIKDIKIINHEINYGYGAALKSGLNVSKGVWILITDSDGTYPIKEIPKLLKHINNYDMIIGSRAKKNIPLVRKPAKWFLGKFAEYITGKKIPDLNSGLRLFKKDLAMRFYTLYPEGFSFTTTITVASLINKYNVKFVDIEYFKRSGTSTIHPVKDFIGFTTLILRLGIFFNPLNVFLPISFFLFIFGAIKLSIDFINLNSFGLGGVMLVLMAIQITLMGMMSELIIKRTKL